MSTIRGEAAARIITMGETARITTIMTETTTRAVINRGYAVFPLSACRA